MNKYLKFLTDKYNRHLAFLSLDELGDSNRIIKFIGLVFITIGGLIFSDKLIVIDLAITSIALFGILFIATDFSKYFILKIDSKKALSDSIRYKKRKNMSYLKLYFSF